MKQPPAGVSDFDNLRVSAASNFRKVKAGGLEGGKGSLKNRRKAADPAEQRGSNDEGAQGERGRSSTSSLLEFPDRQTLPGPQPSVCLHQL